MCAAVGQKTGAGEGSQRNRLIKPIDWPSRRRTPPKDCEARMFQMMAVSVFSFFLAFSERSCHRDTNHCQGLLS